MAVQRYGIIDTTSNLVINVTDVDMSTGWTPPEGCIAIQNDNVHLGYVYSNGTFSSPVTQPSVSQQRAAILQQLEQLDVYISRGLEDSWTASGFDTTKLPTIQQQRLAQKQSLRTQLANLGS